MTILITPEEVISLAFNESDQITAGSINELKILTAEEKYLLPVIGRALYKQLQDDEYTELCERYIKPVLALYVKYLLMPDLTVKLNDLGAQTIYGEHRQTSNAEERRDARTQVRDDADTMLSRLVCYLTQNNEQYPEYEVAHKRTSIVGGIVL